MWQNWKINSISFSFIVNRQLRKRQNCYQEMDLRIIKAAKHHHPFRGEIHQKNYFFGELLIRGQAKDLDFKSSYKIIFKKGYKSFERPNSLFLTPSWHSLITKSFCHASFLFYASKHCLMKKNHWKTFWQINDEKWT